MNDTLRDSSGSAQVLTFDLRANGSLHSKSKHLRQVTFRKDVSWCGCFFVLKWLVAGFGFGGGEFCDISKVMKYA